MKKALLALALLAGAPARAAVIDATFSGPVTSQAGTSTAVGSVIQGEFLYDTLARTYTSFRIAGVNAPAGSVSTARTTPDLLSAIYQAQISAVATGGGTNSSFVLDLEALNPFPSADAVALLQNTGQLTTNLDFASNPASISPSTFGYNQGNANGTGTTRVLANLSTIRVSIAATAVPEPASLALVGMTLAAAALLRRRA